MMILLISAVSGYGMFWIFFQIYWSLHFSIFMGCLFSALIIDLIAMYREGWLKFEELSRKQSDKVTRRKTK